MNQRLKRNKKYGDENNKRILNEKKKIKSSLQMQHLATCLSDTNSSELRAQKTNAFMQNSKKPRRNKTISQPNV